MFTRGQTYVLASCGGQLRLLGFLRVGSTTTNGVVFSVSVTISRTMTRDITTITIGGCFTTIRYITRNVLAISRRGGSTTIWVTDRVITKDTIRLCNFTKVGHTTSVSLAICVFGHCFVLFGGLIFGGLICLFMSFGTYFGARVHTSLFTHILGTRSFGLFFTWSCSTRRRSISLRKVGKVCTRTTRGLFGFIVPNVGGVGGPFVRGFQVRPFNRLKFLDNGTPVTFTNITNLTRITTRYGGHHDNSVTDIYTRHSYLGGVQETTRETDHGG